MWLMLMLLPGLGLIPSPVAQGSDFSPLQALFRCTFFSLLTFSMVKLFFRCEEDILELKLSSSAMMTSNMNSSSNGEWGNISTVNSLSIRAASVASQWLLRGGVISFILISLIM